MNAREDELYLLRLMGEEERSLEDKRRIYVLTALAPLVGLSVTYFFQLHQPVQDPYVRYSYPVTAPLLLAGVLWNLLGGYSRKLELATAGLVALAALLQNLSFALTPHLPPQPLYINTISYWTLVINSGFLLFALPLRLASSLVLLLFAVCAALPWLVNPAAFHAFAVPLLRAQALIFSALVWMIGLAWYRQRFAERATEALLLRELALTDFFSPPGTDGPSAGGGESLTPQVGRS